MNILIIDNENVEISDLINEHPKEDCVILKYTSDTVPVSGDTVQVEDHEVLGVSHRTFIPKINTVLIHVQRLDSRHFGEED
jgi:hypothetical protein